MHISWDKVNPAAPEHQEVNGICKAKGCEVHNSTNILLNNARLSGIFFHHAHAHAVHIINVCAAKKGFEQDGNPTTPYQYSFQCKPSIANFCVFGCPIIFKCYKPNFRSKLITYKQQLQRALKTCVVARSNLKKTKLHTNNISSNNTKALLKPLLLTNPTFNWLTYLNLLKAPGPPVHLQEGSNSSSLPLVQNVALLKVLNSSVPASKPKSLLAATL
jgi:hypothetical protein